jgi:hypothetical protein
MGPAASGAGWFRPPLALSAGCRAATQDVVALGGQLPRLEVVIVRDTKRDTRAAARAIAEELAGFFARQGWISREQAERYSLIP